MAVEIKKVMETDEKGVARQIYPETHVDAIIGLENISGGGSSSGGTKDIPLADESQNGLMSASMVKKLNQLSGSNLTIERVGSV